MELKDSELAHLERLARVKIGGESRKRLKTQLAEIIEFVRKLQEIDTSGYTPQAYVGRFRPTLRDDTVGLCLSRDEVLAESPDSERGFFRVPPVIEKEDTTP